MAQYSREFRENAVRLCEARGWRVAETARELDMKYQTLHGWVTEARGGVGVLKSRQPQEVETAEEELKRLRRDNKRLAEELEIAKKAAAFFARHQK